MRKNDNIYCHKSGADVSCYTLRIAVPLLPIFHSSLIQPVLIRKPVDLLSNTTSLVTATYMIRNSLMYPLFYSKKITLHLENSRKLFVASTISIIIFVKIR